MLFSDLDQFQAIKYYRYRNNKILLLWNQFTFECFVEGLIDFEIADWMNNNFWHQ